MANKARRSALSAAGLMLIAGCSGGGHSVGSAPPSGGGTGPSSLTNGAKVTLSITLAPKQALNGRRISNKARPTVSGKRVPSFVSPSTASVALSAVYNGASVFTTSIYLNQCTNLYVLYECTTNLPVGTYTLYSNLYDSHNVWLGTNMYSNPTAQTIYANGAAPSVYSNYLYVDDAGIAQYVFVAAPANCLTLNSGTTAAPIYVFDADGNEIIGPLANPLVGYTTAVNGAGLGSFDFYTVSSYGTASADHQVIYDTSMYEPFVNVGSSEGSAFLYGFTYNITALFGEGSNGAGSFQAGSPSSPAYTQLAEGTYNAIAFTPGSATANLYEVEETVPAIEQCNSATFYGLSNPTLFGSIYDSNGTSKEMVVVDGQNVDIVGGNSNPVFSWYGGVPQLFLPVTTYALSSTETAVNLFTSPDVQGRFFVITNNSSNSGNGQADQFLAVNGSTTYSGAYQFSFPATTSTRIAGEGGSGQYALYYSSGSDNMLFGVDRTNGTAYPTITAFASGTVYTIQPTGAGFNYIFFRGRNNGAGQYQLCTFDPTVGIGSAHCVTVGSTGAGDSNPVSMRFDSLSHDMMIVVGPTIQGGDAQITPASFSFSALYSSFPTSYTRFTPGEATPGFVGVYDGTSTTTFLQWNGSSWVSYGSVAWGNAWVVPIK
ncbi:MAG: hypothetical protein ABSE64_05145 [Vulcanimicrobiaceae bacterium]